MLGLPILTHEYILKGNGPLGEINVSVPEYILSCLFQKKEAESILIQAETGKSISNNDLVKNIVAVAESLSTKGVTFNDVVGICSENRLEYAVATIAIMSLGATVVTLNPLYTPDELRHVLSISRPKIIFCSSFTGYKMSEVQSLLPCIKEMVLFDGDEEYEGFTSYTQLLSRGADITSFRCAKIDPRVTVAVILCSSGTTGLPKCVELTHSNVMCFINLIGSNISGTVQDAILGLIPMFHGYGFGLLLCSLAYNIKLVLLSRFDETIFLSSIEKYRITRLFLVPPLVLFLTKSPLVDKYDLSSLTDITCGAAPLSTDLQLNAKKRLKLSNQINQGYGMTETSIAVSLMPSEKTKLGSVGVVVGGMECKVINIDTGKALPPFQEGEFCFRGPFIMKGYRNNTIATMETIDSDGWLHTGDVGYYDDEGYLYIVDRIKELIKFKGFQVAPAELEALLLSIPNVKDAAVIGLPNEEVGELPIAFIVKQPNAIITEAEIKKIIADKVSPQKRLHRIIFINEIPKNPSGKILRRELRTLIKKSKL